jgi:SagB-type dehydrogenase family enzyme
MPTADAQLYELFWENSQLNRVTIQAFRRRMEEHAAMEPDFPSLDYPGTEIGLRVPNDGLWKLMGRRRSVRAFSDRPLPSARLGGLFAAFATTAGGARAFPSAGSTYPLEVYCLMNNVEGKLDRRVTYYNSGNHSLSVVGEVPAWPDYSDAVNLDAALGVPHLLFVFVLFPDRTTVKYGERGGRFALIEIGHAAQNLALRLVQERMAGCQIGGLFDDGIKTLLKLEGTRAQIALGYACGLPC